MNAIGPGDWVECVDTSAPPFPTFTNTSSVPAVLAKGGVYLVEQVVSSLQGRPMLVLKQVKALRNHLGAFYAYRFRPVYRPREDLIQQLMQPLPADVEQVHAL